jgi:uncharacterized protein YqeY
MTSSNDMKTAMRNKDSNRLSVLRSILSQTLNASKTSNPINTDMQLLALLRKTSNASKVASEEFKTQGRADLAEKEDLQVSIMEEYAGNVDVMGEEEVRKSVQDVVDALRLSDTSLEMGDVLKKVFSEEVLGGKNVEKAEVTRIVKEILAKS